MFVTHLVHETMKATTTFIIIYSTAVHLNELK